MYASKLQSPRGEPIFVLGEANMQSMRPDGQARLRSQLLTRDHEPGTQEVRDRMKHTVDVMNKGFKPNTRGDFIQDSLATLEELLVKLSESIGFNIEISMLCLISQVSIQKLYIHTR